jgi:hypothetical protein
MSKYKSRAKRAAEQADAWESIACSLRDIEIPEDSTVEEDKSSEHEKECAAAVAEAQEILGEFDSSQLESLKDEMGSWRDNMSGANMEHLPKYEEVSEAADSLDNIESEAPTITSVDEIEEAADELENRASELQDVMFPGMY